MNKRHYEFFELQSQGSDNKWRRFRQFENCTETQAIQKSKDAIKEEKKYSQNLSTFIDLPSPKAWRLVSIVKDCTDVCLLS